MRKNWKSQNIYIFSVQFKTYSIGPFLHFECFEGVSSQVSPQGLGLLVAVVQTNQNIPVVFGPRSFHFVHMKIVDKLRLKNKDI